MFLEKLGNHNIYESYLPIISANNEHIFVEK